MIYERLKGGEGIDKLPVWYVLSGIKRILEGENTFEQVATFLNLDQDEQTEFQTMTDTVGSKFTAHRDNYVVGSITQAQAGQLAKAIMFQELWSKLLDVEVGVLSEADFNTYFGL